MEATPAKGLQLLLLQRAAELGEPGIPMSIRELVERSGGVLDYDRLRAIGRGERPGVLTVRQAAALADALEVPISEVEAAAIILREA